MKFLAVFAAVLAVACASNSWTLEMLSDATTSSHTDPALKPYLEAALNDMMAALWAGENVDAVTVTIPTVEVSSMTINELSDAIQDPNTDPALIPQLEAALNEMMEAVWSGKPVESVVVAGPAMEVHYYSLNDLSLALQDPTTNPELIPYLEHALNTMMASLFEGEQMNAIVIAVPAGLTPVEVPVQGEFVPVMPVIPVVPTQPEQPAQPEAPVQPEIVTAPEAPASSASPLVQIIVNINQQQAAAAVPVSPVAVPAGEIAADPVNVVDSAPVVDPIQVVDTAPIDASPVQVVDTAPIEASPVQVVDTAPIAVSPVQVVEPVFAIPIQVIDSAPIAPEPVIGTQPIFTL